MINLIGDIYKRDHTEVYIKEIEMPLIQYTYEFEELKKIVSKMKPRCILEIGTCRGGSLYSFMQCMQGGKIVSIDIPGGFPQHLAAWHEWAADKKLEFLHIQADSHLESTKRQLIDFLGNDLLDFLFIDGDHSYAGVKADFMQYSCLVRNGGIVAMHDIRMDGKVHKFWEEVIEAGYVTRSLLSKPNQDIMGIGVVYF